MYRLKRIKELFKSYRTQKNTEILNDIDAIFNDNAKAPVAEINLNNCVGQFYTGFGEYGWNPFTESVKRYIKYGNWDYLSDYYNISQPKNLSEAYFVREKPLWRTISQFSPYARVVPWRKSIVYISGYKGEGNQNFGPVTRAKFSNEIKRFEKILNSFEINGYDPEKLGFIKGYFLVNERKKFVFCITQGVHRLSVLDALGKTNVVVKIDERLPRFISCDTLPFWPHVKSGMFPPSLASYMFYRNFWDRGGVKRKTIGKKLNLKYDFK